MSRDHFDGFVVIGYSRNIYGEKPIFSKSDEFVTLEEYIKLEASWFFMLIARLFGRVYVGEYKPARPDYDYSEYYLVWCKKHKEFNAVYRHGKDRTPCPKCEEIFVNQFKVRNGLKLVKSDRGLES